MVLRYCLYSLRRAARQCFGCDFVVSILSQCCPSEKACSNARSALPQRLTACFSSSELEDLFGLIGQPMGAAGRGALQGRFQFLSDQHSAVLRLQSSLGISIGCSRNPALIAFSLEAEGKEQVAYAWAAHPVPCRGWCWSGLEP